MPCGRDGDDAVREAGEVSQVRIKTPQSSVLMSGPDARQVSARDEMMYFMIHFQLLPGKPMAAGLFPSSDQRKSIVSRPDSSGSSAHQQKCAASAVVMQIRHYRFPRVKLVRPAPYPADNTSGLGLLTMNSTALPRAAEPHRPSRYS